MDIWKCCAKVMLKIQKGRARYLAKALFFLVLHELWGLALGLGSMSSIAISYGESGPVFCGLKPDGSHLVTCYGSNSAIIYATPAHSPFMGLTAGSGFVCGLLMDSKQPYCWGSSGLIQTGVPQPMSEGSEYLEISAGDHHVCGLRKGLMGRHRNISLVDCWGYNMTTNNVFDGQVQSISAGSEFNCGLFSQNRTVFCWGDETSSRVISLIPREMRFQKIAAGGFHVCGIVEGVNARVFCWGRSLELEEQIPLVHSSQVSVDLAPNDPMLSVVGGRFHACGIKSHDGGASCWGYRVEGSTGAPNGIRLFEIAAGDYFTCGVAAERSLLPVCWGAGFPSSLPLAVSPGLCKSNPCAPGFYEFNNGSAYCKSPATHICLPCTNACPAQMYQKAQCTATSDQQCEFNCSICASADCFSNCSYSNIASHGRRNVGFWSLQLPVVIAFAVFLVSAISLTALLYVRCRLRSCSCRCSAEGFRPSKKNYASGSSVRRDGSGKLKFGRARIFSYKELEKATGGFTEESQVGKGSFSCVFRGVLKEGTVVAVKRATVSAEDVKKSSKDQLFHNELDLLSRLNHAHLLNLLGYCEEGGERLLVYEFMANGSLHQHLHGKKEGLKEQLDWIRRVTIAVQAARGIEYLHGYACPPVIHRDIKSSNILIDEEQNARVSDFGLSLLGPASSSSPLAELPAGTLGYLDPEYYRLHYLTTKSDVYSFGVLLLEIVSGRKAIDMQFEEGNIVEWAVPLIKAGDIQGILDPVLEAPSQTSMEALKRIANVACKCVRMRGKERPSMDEVTTALERALAQLMGNPSNEQPILPTEVVLGSSRLHKKSSQRSSNRSTSETESEDHRLGFRAPSWITFPSSTVASSQRWKSSVSDADIEGRNLGNGGAGAGNGLRSLEEEIGPASPQQNLFLQHNF